MCIMPAAGSTKRAVDAVTAAIWEILVKMRKLEHVLPREDAE